MMQVGVDRRFYEDIEPLGSEEKKALLEMPATDRELMSEYAIASTEGAGRSLPSYQRALAEHRRASERVRRRRSSHNHPVRSNSSDRPPPCEGYRSEEQVERLIVHKEAGLLVTSDSPDARHA